MHFSGATRSPGPRGRGAAGRGGLGFAELQACSRRAAFSYLAAASSTLLLPLAFGGPARAGVFDDLKIPESDFQKRLSLLKSTRERIMAIQRLGRAAARGETLPIDDYEVAATVQADELEKFFISEPEVVRAVESPVDPAVPGFIAEDAVFDTFLRHETELLRSAAESFDDQEDTVSRYVIERTVIVRETIVIETRKAAEEKRPVVTVEEVVTQNRERTQTVIGTLRALEEQKAVAENVGTVERQTTQDGLTTSGVTLLAFNGVAAVVSAGSCSAFCATSAAVGAVLCWLGAVS